MVGVIAHLLILAQQRHLASSAPWVLAGVQTGFGVVLWLRRHRRVGRGMHSEYAAELSVASLANTVVQTYEPQDAQEQEEWVALCERVQAKLTDVFTAVGITVPGSAAEPGGRHRLVEPADVDRVA